MELPSEVRIYCAGAGIVDPDAGTYTICGNPATHFRYVIADNRGWAILAPLCEPHAALWDEDVRAAQLRVTLAQEAS